MIGIAIKSIFDGNNALKTVMPKFVLALIFVNFSWFAVKVVVDMGTVLTAVVYKIPNEFMHQSDIDRKDRVVVDTVFNYVPDLRERSGSDNESNSTTSDITTRYPSLMCVVEADKKDEANKYLEQIKKCRADKKKDKKATCEGKANQKCANQYTINYEEV